MSNLEPSAVRSLSPPQPGNSLPVHRTTRDAWLREVEHARWEQQPRYQRDQGGAEGSSDVLSCADTSARLVTAGPRDAADAVGVAPETAEGVTPRAVRTEVSLETHDAMPGQLTGTQLSSHLQPAPTRVPSTRRNGGDGLEVAQQRSATLPRQAGMKTEWLPYALHVEHTDDEIAVWLRDAHLGTQEALGLLDRLSQAFSGSSFADRALRLTVNGQPVSRGDLARHPTVGEGIKNGN